MKTSSLQRANFYSFFSYNNRLSGRSEALSARTDLLNGSSDPLKHFPTILLHPSSAYKLTHAATDCPWILAETLRYPIKDRFGLHIRVKPQTGISLQKSHFPAKLLLLPWPRIMTNWYRLTKTKQTSGCFPIFKSLPTIKPYPQQHKLKLCNQLSLCLKTNSRTCPIKPASACISAQNRKLASVSRSHTFLQSRFSLH